MVEYYTEGFKHFTPNKANTKIQLPVVMQVHCQWRQCSLCFLLGPSHRILSCSAVHHLDTSKSTHEKAPPRAHLFTKHWFVKPTWTISVLPRHIHSVAMVLKTSASENLWRPEPLPAQSPDKPTQNLMMPGAQLIPHNFSWELLCIYLFIS